MPKVYLCKVQLWLTWKKTMNPVAAVDLFESTSSIDLRVLPKYTLMICAGKSPKTVAIKYSFALMLLTCKK